MVVDKDTDNWVFKKSDCVVVGATVEKSTGGVKAPRWGSQAGNVITVGGIDMIASPEDLNSVSVRHQPTCIVVTVNKFHAHRNKNLAIKEIEKRVNKLIADEKARVAEYNASKV
jgi:hypothetical protein